MIDGEIDRLNGTYRFELEDRYGWVFVRIATPIRATLPYKIGVYGRGTDGQPTGDALMRFANIEDAEEWLYERILRDQEEPAE